MATYFSSIYDDEREKNGRDEYAENDALFEGDSSEFYDNDDDFNIQKAPYSESPYYTPKDVDLQQLMNDYHSDEPWRVERSMNIMHGLLKHYIFYIIKRKYSNYAKDYFEDMVQQAYLGVFKGMQVYVPSRSAPSTFFHSYIVHEIQAFIDTEVHRTTAHYSTCIKKIKKVLREYEASNLQCTPKDLEIETGFAPDTINQCLKIMNTKETSLETSLEDNVTLESVLPSGDKTPEQEYIDAERSSTILKALCLNLTEQEKMIIEMNFGLNGREQLSTKKISAQLGIPTDRVNRILSEAFKKLKKIPELRGLKPDMQSDEWANIMNNANLIPVVCEEDTSIAIESFKSIDFGDGATVVE